jgi:phosphohistidine phosphatase SixA
MDSLMSERKIYLVRHGQASLGAADYDNLSERGEQQALRLGEYFASRGITFDAAYGGTLKRHAQTYNGITRGMNASQAMPDMALRAGLNEYDSEAVIGAICTPEQFAQMKSPKQAKATSSTLRCYGAVLALGCAASRSPWA